MKAELLSAYVLERIQHLEAKRSEIVGRIQALRIAAADGKSGPTSIQKAIEEASNQHTYLCETVAKINELIAIRNILGI